MKQMNVKPIGIQKSASLGRLLKVSYTQYVERTINESQVKGDSALSKVDQNKQIYFKASSLMKDQSEKLQKRSYKSILNHVDPSQNHV